MRPEPPETPARATARAAVTLLALAAVVLAALVFAGCGPSPATVEDTIRREALGEPRFANVRVIYGGDGRLFRDVVWLSGSVATERDLWDARDYVFMKAAKSLPKGTISAVMVNGLHTTEPPERVKAWQRGERPSPSLSADTAQPWPPRERRCYATSTRANAATAMRGHPECEP